MILSYINMEPARKKRGRSQEVFHNGIALTIAKEILANPEGEAKSLCKLMSNLKIDPQAKDVPTLRAASSQLVKALKDKPTQKIVKVFQKKLGSGPEAELPTVVSKEFDLVHTPGKKFLLKKRKTSPVKPAEPAS